jgi:predicted  nucleic acid-binding Zn-ribbon protein
MPLPVKGPDDRVPDLTGTDTIPLPLLRAEDTGRLEGADLLAEAEQEEVRVYVRPRVPVQDRLSSTDTFRAGDAAPMLARQVGTSDLAETLRENEQQLARAQQRIAELESRLAAAESRCRRIAAERDAALARAASAPAAADMGNVQRDLDAMRRANERLHEALCTMEARIGVHAAMLSEAEEALQAARKPPADGRRQPAQPDAAAAPQSASGGVAQGADAVGRDDALRIDWRARFIELEKVLDAERTAAAEKVREYEQRIAELEAERDRQVQAAAATPRPLSIGTVLRVLVREEDGTEFVYPLGRHTTIGRAPDNDIQVNTTFVSRHHAVLLTSNEHCIAEDLNSTNGILVNGQRVRQALLHHGDVLTIGRTNFRYETRQ